MRKIGTVAVLLAALGSTGAAADVVERSFDARALSLREVAAEVHVRVDPGTLGITLSARGDARRLKTLRAQAVDGTLVISGGGEGGTVSVGSVTTIVTGGSSASVTIGGAGQGQAREGLTLDLTVPAGTPVGAVGFVGELEIGETGAPLDLDLNAGSVRAAAVTRAAIRVSGAGEVVVERVDGPVSARLDGTGRIAIRGGAISTLEAAVDGAGDIQVSAPVREADLALRGVGSIEVASVERNPRIRRSGVGEIRVGGR